MFAKDEFDLGCFSEIQHRIDTGDSRPVRQRLRRTPLGFEDEEAKHLKKMLDANIIKPSHSEYASAPVQVRKKDGSVRWSIDYRALNKATKKDSFPMPLIEKCLDQLSGNVYFSTLDMASGYYQVEVHPEDCYKTAFVTKYGLYQYRRMPFGLTNSPATFSKAVSLILRGLTWKEILAYLDDVVVRGRNFNDHLRNLKMALERLKKVWPKAKTEKVLSFPVKSGVPWPHRQPRWSSHQPFIGGCFERLANPAIDKRC